MAERSQFTEILIQVQAGDALAGERLLPLVYDELRRLAAAKLAHEKPGQTLQATALVHEAWLRLAGSQQSWTSRTPFFAAAAESMRRILVDRARRKAAQKRAGVRVEADESDFAVMAQPDEVVAVHDALDALAAEDRLAADLVKLHYFGGFPLEEAAELLGMSRATGYRLWTYARAWLRAAMQDNLRG